MRPFMLFAHITYTNARYKETGLRKTHRFTTCSPPLKVYSHTTVMEIPFFLEHKKVHYRVQRSSTYVPVLSKINPAYILTSHFFRIYFNIILPCISVFHQIPPPLDFLTRTWYIFLVEFMRATCPVHHIVLHLIIM
jgi:hypothetical protein